MRIRPPIRLLAPLVPLLLCSCVSMYQPPVQDASLARIHFVDKHTGAGQGHFYLWHSTPSCAKAAGEGRIAALDWLNGQEKEAMVKSGQRGYLLAHRQSLSDVQTAGDQTKFSSDYCRRVVSFIPEATHEYRVETGELPLCDVVVVDLTTNSPPETLEKHEVSGRCLEKEL